MKLKDLVWIRAAIIVLLIYFAALPFFMARAEACPTWVFKNGRWIQVCAADEPALPILKPLPATCGWYFVGGKWIHICV